MSSISNYEDLLATRFERGLESEHNFDHTLVRVLKLKFLLKNVVRVVREFEQSDPGIFGHEDEDQLIYFYVHAQKAGEHYTEVIRIEAEVQQLLGNGDMTKSFTKQATRMKATLERMVFDVIYQARTGEIKVEHQRWAAIPLPRGYRDALLEEV